MKNYTLLTNLLIVIFLTIGLSVNAQCPDVVINKVAITQINSTFVTYDFEIQNIGADTMFLNKVVFQHYASTDSANNKLCAAGGSYIDYYSKGFILPGEKYTGTQYVSINLCSASTFFEINASYTGKAECNTSNNVYIKRIEMVTPVDAQFSNDITTGIVPLTVHFTDTSTGNPTSWKWDFTNDGVTDSTSQNPLFTYDTPGTYSVKLVASKLGSKDSVVKTSYIVAESPVDARFTADLTTGTAPFTVHFTDTSSGEPVSWKWDFDNDGSIDSTSQNPSFIYNNPGTYSVKLVASKPGSSDTITQVNYITVNTPAAVSDYSENNLSVYPNPTTGKCTLELGNEMRKQDITIEVYNYSGQLIFTEISNGSKKVEMDLSAYGSGVYIMKIKGISETFTRKILVK